MEPHENARLVPIDTLRGWERNPRTITPERLESLKRALRAAPAMLWARPLVALADGRVILGNQRLRAMQEMHADGDPAWQDAPVVTVLLDEETAAEWAIRDNNEYGVWQEDELADLLRFLERGGRDLDLTGFDGDELRRLLGDLEHAESGAGEQVETPSLADRFVIPPFSILDQRAGYWQERRRRWLALGIQSELGRDGNALIPNATGQDPGLYRQKNDVEQRLGRRLTTREFLDEHYVPLEGVGGLSTTGTSVFDPVLCEIAYRWFSPPGGRVLDPFAGGSVRGIVASVLGRRYVGIDLSATQVDANREQALEILGHDADHVDDPLVVTPIEERAGILVKRDDLFGVNGATGGKARAILEIASFERAAALVGVGARTSPQIARVARVAQHLGIPARVHTGVGGDTEETMAAALAGATVVRHAPARLAVMRKRAADDSSGVLIPWGAEHEITVKLAAYQTANVPLGIRRVVVPVGSGTTLAGVVRGLWDRTDVSFLGVRMGADPAPVLDRYAPTGWRDRVHLVSASQPFSERVPGALDGLPLDPVYEAKCLPWLRGGDLFWIVGGPQAPAPNHPEWIAGSLDTDVLLEDHGGEFDLVFTCPPYYNLERYSDDPRDLSTMTPEAFEETYERILAEAVLRLAPDSFAIVVVSDVRGESGNYQPMSDLTTRIMGDLNVGLYNRAILVNQLGSWPVRVARQFTSTRKLGRTHQDVMVYVKGDGRRAAERCGEVDITLEEVLDAATGDPLDPADAADPTAG